MAKRKQAGKASAGTPASDVPRKAKAKAAQPKVAATRASQSGSVPAALPSVVKPKKAARPKATPSRRGATTGFISAAISRRLREIRQELFGDMGGPELARRLNLPARTWYNYETDVSVPAEVLLAFSEQTGADPWWVLTGQGSKYRRSDGT